MALALFPVWNSLARVKVGVSRGHWHGCFWLEAILVWASPESKPSTRIWMQVVYVGMILGSRMWEEGEQGKKKTKIMVHFQSQCIGNRCLIFLGSSKRQSKICLQELCFQKTKDWDICFLASGSHWLRVVPGCTDTLTLVGYVCLQSRQLCRVGMSWKEAFLWWHEVRMSYMTEVRIDHRDGRQVSEASVTEAKYESLWGGKLLVPSSPSFVLYWAPAVCLGMVGTQWFFVESINECKNLYSINVWWELIVCLKASLSSSSKCIHVVRPGAVILLWKIWYQIMEMWSLSLDRSRR